MQFAQRHARDHEHGHRRHALKNVDDTHDKLIDPFAEVPRQASEQNAEQSFQYNDDEPYCQRDSAAVHQAREHVETQIVGAQPVRGRGRQVNRSCRVGHDVNDDRFAVYLRFDLFHILFHDGVVDVLFLFAPDAGKKAERRSQKGKQEEQDENDQPRNRKFGTEKALQNDTRGAERAHRGRFDCGNFLFLHGLGFGGRFRRNGNLFFLIVGIFTHAALLTYSVSRADRLPHTKDRSIACRAPS